MHAIARCKKIKLCHYCPWHQWYLRWKVPELIFLSFLHYQEGLSVPTAEELQDIIKHQYEKSQESNDSLYEIEPCENDSSDTCDYISRLEKKSDALGFDRKSALEKIVRSIELDRLYKSRNKNET